MVVFPSFETKMQSTTESLKNTFEFLPYTLTEDKVFEPSKNPRVT